MFAEVTHFKDGIHTVRLQEKGDNVPNGLATAQQARVAPRHISSWHAHSVGENGSPVAARSGWAPCPGCREFHPADAPAGSPVTARCRDATGAQTPPRLAPFPPLARRT